MRSVGGYASASADLVKQFDEVLGGDRYNHAPKDWREITEKEFSQSQFFGNTPVALEFRQLNYDYDNNRLKNDNMLSVQLYLYEDGTGIGLARDYWKGKARYFKFGCQHDYQEYGPAFAKEHNLPYYAGNCLHNTQCTKCHRVWCYDSSD